MGGLRVVKAHAYGNDFLFVPEADARADAPALARALCARHDGVGADGLILYTLRERGATMTLFNADGSLAELSGNGLRCLAALVARAQQLEDGATITVDTGAGTRRLDLLARDGERYTCRAAMGQPQDSCGAAVHDAASALGRVRSEAVVSNPVDGRYRN